MDPLQTRFAVELEFRRDRSKPDGTSRVRTSGYPLFSANPALPACAALILLLAAGTARAQAPETFTDALVTFTSAAASPFGDAGPVIVAAIDAMDRALRAWDHDIRLLETRAGEAASSGQPDEATRRFTDLARASMARGQAGDARTALEEAIRHDAGNRSAHLLLGLLHAQAQRPAQAATAYQRAWESDPADPVAGYLLWTQRAHLDTVSADRLLAAFTGWYERVGASYGQNAPAPPFPDTSLLPDVATASPLLPPALYAEGFRRLARGELAEAIGVFRERAAMDSAVSGPAANDQAMRRGAAALREGRVPDAQAAFADAGHRLEGSGEPHRMLGLAAWAAQSGGAIEHLRRAVALSPRDERTRLSLARVLVGSDRLDEAEGFLAETIALLPDSAAAYWWLGTVYNSLNRTTDALRVFEQAAALPLLTGRDTLLATIADLRERHADFEGAAAAHAARVAEDPNNTLAHLYLARAYEQLGRQDDAFVEYVAAAAIDARLPGAHAGIGHYHLAAGRYVQAAAALERAVHLEPRSTEARYALALALRDAGRAEESAAHLRAFHDLQTQAVHERRSTMTLDVLKEEAALRTAEGAHDAAAALWERIVQQQPGEASHHVSLAAALAASGRAEAAAARYEHAAALGGQPQVYKALASLYASMGRTRESAAALDRYEQALLKALGTAGTSR